jgi:myo-inositol-1(or 4)-monophosphatase
LPGSERAALKGKLEAIMREAGELARVTASRPLKHWTKGHDRSPVSEADIAVNDLLRDRLAALTPGAGWLSEETEDNLSERDRPQTWVVDPIDGTRAYISGRTDWTISVALVEDGRPAVAALFAPVTEEMFIAVRGEGATLNGNPMHAPNDDGLTGAKIAGPKRYLAWLESLTPSILPQAKIHSLALRLTRVAHGDLDAAFASGGSHDWDLAAADLLVHEAGGLLTDLSGRSLRYNRPHVVHGALVAAGPIRHGMLVALVRDRMPEFA